MAEFKFTNKAVIDLIEIWNYTLNKWSEDKADRYYNMTIENCRLIALNPEIGKNYSGVAENLFGFKAGRHLIFYHRISDNEVEIIRILHEQMDIKNRIAEK